MSKIQKWLDQGMTAQEIALKWNAGGAKTCSKGINSKGVPYDSCKYVEVTMNHYYKRGDFNRED